MISEKTVELNLTTELVNWLFYHTGIRPYILAPSQRDEGTLGFDTSITIPTFGRPFLIQYKRAKLLQNGEYKYKINDTANQDQHNRLLFFERQGFFVFYALPIFTTSNEVISYRRRLLKITAFRAPSSILLPGGPIGKHSVYYNPTTYGWRVRSEEVKLNGSSTYEEIFKKYIAEMKEMDIKKFLLKCNKTIFESIEYQFKDIPLKPKSDLTYGLSAVVIPRKRKKRIKIKSK